MRAAGVPVMVVRSTGTAAGLTVSSDEDPSGTDQPRQRACMRCRTAFQSSWSGERICGPCKRTRSWRQDIPLQQRSGGTGRAR